MALLSNMGHRRKPDREQLATEARGWKSEALRLRGRVARLDAENQTLAGNLIRTTAERNTARTEADELRIEHDREVKRLAEDNTALRAKLAEAHPVHQDATIPAATGEDTVEMEQPPAGAVLAVEPLPAKPVQVTTLAARFAAGAAAARRTESP